MIRIAILLLALVATACTNEMGTNWSYAPLTSVDTSARPEATALVEAVGIREPTDGGMADTQYVSDVARGFGLYQINCAACHGPDGQGGIGPSLNDQAKLFDAITPSGEPGSGHLNPVHIDRVLTEGGSYVCGDPLSIMIAYKEPNGYLSDRQVQELIAWITASSEIVFDSGSGMVSGWRDPSWEPEPEITPVPACWKD